MKIGFFGLLTVLLIALKLIGIITWSWWLVIIPLFVPFVIWIFLMILLLIAIIKANC